MPSPPSTRPSGSTGRRSSAFVRDDSTRSLRKTSCLPIRTARYNRAEFLDLIGKRARISELREDQVNVRLFGDFAIIHARIQYRSKAGIERIGRYTDDWARRDGKWLCVSAQTSGEDL